MKLNQIFIEIILDEVQVQPMTNFSDSLRKRRKERGFTQESLADKIGVQSRRYAHWETGKHEPPYEILALICEALATDANSLLGIAVKQENEGTPDKVLEQIRSLLKE